ncbi:MAG TPA: aromatic amino acid lyase [Gaiellaceae bacterium]|nr:aromatic amino acid lyase [Gaiellaceae bacterium]
MIVLDRHDVLDRGLYERIARDGEHVAIAREALEHVERRRDLMLVELEGGAPAYGVTTGLGYLSRTQIAPEDRIALQRSILLGRAVAVGPPLPREVVRGAMLLRLTGFLGGAAGVSAALCTYLADRLNDDWYPEVPARPHGAAGEITLLAHLFATFVGQGFVLEDGERTPAARGLAARGAAPYVPGLKEGIALVNGAPFAPALTAPLVRTAERVLEHAILAAAFGVAAVGASGRPFSARIGELKGDPGQLRVHERLAELVDDRSDAPQAPVSFRVAPQVLGAAADVLAAATAQLERELRAVTDSPLFLDAADGEAGGFYPSGGFHAQALTFALDTLAAAFAQVGTLSEKRLHRLLDARFSGLTEQLALEPGKHTGLSVVHKAVVALCVENRLLASPVSVTAADTSTGQEDVQAFTPLAAERLERVLANVELVHAYELLALAQARRLRGGFPPALEQRIARVLEAVPPVEEDRPLAPDVERLLALVRSGEFL